MRREPAAIALSTLTLAALTLVPAAHATPPEPPSAEQAGTMLAGLTVEEEPPRDGYDRDKFPHWNDHGNNCDTRDVVLQRDGENVQVDDECEPVSGRWYSVYDDRWIDTDSDIQIDHLIPLAESWESGADAWTTDRRRQLANDLETSALVAVSGPSNQEKGDQDPAAWMPSNPDIHCLYVRQWIWVKDSYGLHIDPAEKATLEDELADC